jgi:hypothetical protein
MRRQFTYGRASRSDHNVTKVQVAVASINSVAKDSRAVAVHSKVVLVGVGQDNSHRGHINGGGLFDPDVVAALARDAE